MYLLIVFLSLLGSVAGCFLGAEGSAMMTTTKKWLFLGIVFLFFLMIPFVRVKGAKRRLLYASSFFFIGFLRVLIGIEITGFALSFFGAFLGGTCAFTNSSGSLTAEDNDNSELFTYTSDLSDSLSSGLSSSVNQPIQREQAGPSNVAPQPSAPPVAQEHHQPFAEDEARAFQHAQIYAEVETITTACESLQTDMINQAHILLNRHGITLDDNEDVRRALLNVLYEDWEHNIDDRLRHFTMLKRNFGTIRCERWNFFIDELRSLGNHQVNAFHYVD